MCGIVGFTGNNPWLLRDMMNAVYHRGPDASGQYIDTDVSLGMRRLSIVDLEAQQPVYNENKTIVVFMNGEIYNHTELRKDLEKDGHVFLTAHSDTEVIPHLFEKYGEDWVKKVNGMFAVAIWDKREKRLLLYRDRIGKKPLYYVENPNIFMFGSEIKAILKNKQVSFEINHSSMYTYFQKKCTNAPNTIYKEIKQLLPGHFLEVRNYKITKIKRYWSVNTVTDLKIQKVENLVEEFLHLLTNSVYIRTKCDVPFGAYLSGGIDSSSIVSILSKIKENKNINTFCLGYIHDNSPQFIGKDADVYWARALSKLLGTRHHELFLDAKIFAEAMPAVLSSFDEPFSGVVSTYFISKLIKEHVSVALSGDGADELFGSYLTHRLAVPMYEHLCSTRNMLSRWKGHSDFNTLYNLTFGNTPWKDSFNVFTHRDLNCLFQHPMTPVIDCGEDFNSTDPVNSVLKEDQQDILPNQVLAFVDRLSMAHSVEVRCPYLDYRLIEFVNAIPGKLKVYNNKTKVFQKYALLNRILPKEIISRKKEGFVQPIYSWMKNELNSWIFEYLDALPSEIINKNYAMKLDVNKDQAKIWNLVCFSIWYNTKGRIR